MPQLSRYKLRASHFVLWAMMFSFSSCVIRDACYAIRVVGFGVGDPMPDPQSFCFAQLVTPTRNP